MNVLDAITQLRNDLDRTVESLEALRNGFALYAEIAPDLDKPHAPVMTAKAGARLKQFLAGHTQLQEGAFVSTSALWKAYLRWCRTNRTRAITQGQFRSRLCAAGYRYSRSRRIDGIQARTWEGIKLRKAA